jgi:dTDP-4-dehydrorhamnose 3,5-epimerase-like enzyme
MDCLVNLKALGDERGLLVAIESLKQIPFNFERVYYLTGLMKEFPRGFHAHKQIKQFAVCLSGSCRFVMDDGNQKKEFLMNSPAKGIVIDTMVWHEMHDFSENCILLVLASHHYDENDYIRNYEEFKKYFSGD